MIYPKLMRYSKLTDQAAAVAVALGELDVRPDDRVLIMLPDGPDFAESFTGVMQQGAVPLPVNPLLPARDVVSAATAAGAQLVLAPVDRLQELAELDATPPALIDGPHGLWAAAFRLPERPLISTVHRRDQLHGDLIERVRDDVGERERICLWWVSMIGYGEHT